MRNYKFGLYILAGLLLLLGAIYVYQRFDKALQGKEVIDRYWQVIGVTDECRVELVGRELPPELPSDCLGPFDIEYFVVIEDDDPVEFEAHLWFKLEPGTNVLTSKDYNKLISEVEVR